MNNSLSIFANALASENLSFSFDAEAATASFDVKSRHLVMPVWDVSETVQTMLIAHEISHALWTPYEQSEQLLAAAEKDGYDRTLLQRIANVVEDVRIEKMMKAKFPGTRRDFYLGYKEIVDRDMFKFSSMDLTKASLVDRMNLHFKWGVPGFLGINLSDAEQGVADMIDGVVSFEDTIRVAKYLYEHPSMQKVVQKAQKDASGNMTVEEGDPSESDTLMDTDLPGKGKKGGDQYNAATITIPQLEDYRSAIIDSATVLEGYIKHNSPFVLNEAIEEYRKYARESDAFVRQLVAQFERRKAADEIRRERPKQTGMLNLDRLHQYRTHDDIFLSKIIKQDGKNHGIVFMLDFSGSMDGTLHNCYLQVLQLVWFCDKAKIPFDVFAFTDIPESLLRDDYSELLRDFFNDPKNQNKRFVHPASPKEKNLKATSLTYNQAKLIRIASSNDSAKNREELLAYLYGSLVLHTVSRPFSLRFGGTPTVECLAIASAYMKDWVKANDIQIPTLMVVTDGEPNGVDVVDMEVSKHFHSLYDPHSTMTVINEVMGTVNRLNAKDMMGLCIGNMLISTMLTDLRNQLNARCVGMFVGGSRLSPGQFIAMCCSNEERMNHMFGYRNGVQNQPRFKAAEEAYKSGCILVHPDRYPGYDAFFFTKTPKIVDDADAIAESGTFTKIKNTFIKTMSQRNGNRVFLSRYIDIVAGQPLRKKGADDLYDIPLTK